MCKAERGGHKRYGTLSQKWTGPLGRGCPAKETYYKAKRDPVQGK